MKWYNYEDQWVNLQYIQYIYIWDDMPGFTLFTQSDFGLQFQFDTLQERNEEFEKIKVLMEVYRNKNDWTPGRCC